MRKEIQTEKDREAGHAGPINQNTFPKLPRLVSESETIPYINQRNIKQRTSYMYYINPI
jgi:hypothetical protein